jgi:nicotinamidase-related amidase
MVQLRLPPSPPSSLGAIVGLPLDRAVLLLVDCQRAFVEPAFRTAPSGAEEALESALRLRNAFRAAGRPVAWTRHAHLLRPKPGGMGSFWRSFLMEGDAGATLVSCCAPLENEPVFRKEHYSAFRGTGLEAWLSVRQPRLLVLAGFLTHLCVDTTARDAFMSGLDVVVASDACAAPVGRDGTDLHAASLLALGHGVARVLPVSSLLSSFGVPT